MVVQDGSAAKRIADGVLLHQIHITAKDIFKLVNHIHPVKQVPVIVRGKADQDINVAFRTKIAPQDRAKQRKFDNLPLTAEGGNVFLVNGYRGFHILLPGCFGVIYFNADITFLQGLSGKRLPSGKHQRVV